MVRTRLPDARHPAVRAGATTRSAAPIDPFTRPEAPSRPPAAGRSRRVAGIDLARALAILGMLAVHIGPTDGEGFAGTVYAAPHGRASILFAVVAGVGVSLLARSRSTSPVEARLKLLWRAAVLLPVGLALQELDHGAYVILQDYAVLFVLAVVVLGAGDRWLLALAAAAGLVGPVTYVWGHVVAPDNFTRDPVAITDPAGEIVHGLVLSGPYPLITWAAPFLVGMWLGRRDLRSGPLRVRLLVGGAGAAITALGASALLTAVAGEPADPVGWDHLLSATAHSQMPLWLAGATGSAAAILGGALVVGDVAGRWVWPLVATGQLALTVYVGHLLALHAAPEALTSATVGGAVLLVLAFALVAAAFATAWRALLPHGPLEYVLHAPWRRGRPPT